MRNPALLEEKAAALKPGTKSKKVLIIGGGIAGIEAALDLKKTGNEPVIYEKSGSLGGQFVLAGVAPGKRDFSYAAEKAVANVADQGIEVHLNTEAGGHCGNGSRDEIRRDSGFPGCLPKAWHSGLCHRGCKEGSGHGIGCHP